MKTYTVKEKQSQPARRNLSLRNIRYPVSTAYQAQQTEIHRILRSTGTQTKLNIGQPYDKYEQEADQIADKVMAMPYTEFQGQTKNEKTVSKKEDEQEFIQKRLLPRQNPPSSADVQPQIQSLKGNGQSLPKSAREYFEPRFGVSFKNVRVHSDNRAVLFADSLNAQAFTHGQNIVFGKGHYSPGSRIGRKLLAHELTHVVQQDAVGGKGSLIQRKLAVDPKKFTGAKANKDLLSFKQMIVKELNAVTGLNLEFSGNNLISKKGRTKGRSKTATTVLNMAMSAGRTIFIDPRKKLGAAHTKRGIEISVTRLPLRLKSLNPGIVIIHELAHHFAGRLKPPDYDKKMKTLQKKADKGGTLTPQEAELLLHYNLKRIQSDENIPTSIANKVRDELGLIKRTHYRIDIEYPKKPGKTGTEKFTPYTQFKTTGSSGLYIYLDIKTWDLYSSKIDYFQELVKTGRPVIPKPSDFNKIVKNSSYYKAIKKHLL